jgi:hypothetical protein
MNKLLILGVLGLTGFAGIATLGATSANAAAKHATTGLVTNADAPTGTPKGATITNNEGVVNGNWPVGTQTVTLPDGSQGVINAPAGFVPGQTPSDAIKTN